jgi:hypothetical protein
MTRVKIEQLFNQRFLVELKKNSDETEEAIHAMGHIHFIQTKKKKMQE